MKYNDLMLRSVPLTAGEAYHIFNRGAHKSDIFMDDRDYQRFQVGLHLANHCRPIVMRTILASQKYREPFSAFPADKSLVDVLAYALMPNHFHLVLREKTDGGITTFMKKVSVSYSMYFNLRYRHSGTLLQGPFKSSHLNSDAYFKWIFAYVHLNPISIVEPRWKENGTIDPANARNFLDQYRYSSYFDYYVAMRPERAILEYQGTAPNFLDKASDMRNMIAEYKEGKDEYTENRSL